MKEFWNGLKPWEKRAVGTLLAFFAGILFLVLGIYVGEALALFS